MFTTVVHITTDNVLTLHTFQKKKMTAALRRHLSRIALDEKLFELLKYSLNISLKDEQNFHKKEVTRINLEIEQCTEILKKMYIDQINKVLDIDLWLNFKNEYEVKLNKLNAELQRYQNANVDYMQTGMKLLEICHKASLPYSKISPQEIAQMVWQTYSSVTVKGKSVKLKFTEPFDTIEKLVRTAKQGIEEYGYDKFFEVLKESKNDCIQSIKKEPVGSVYNRFTCMKWWA